MTLARKKSNVIRPRTTNAPNAGALPPNIAVASAALQLQNMQRARGSMMPDEHRTGNGSTSTASRRALLCCPCRREGGAFV